MVINCNNIPAKFNILITSRCNLSCKHCYLSKRATEMSIDFFSYIIDYLDEIKAEEICIEGGEPLCHSNFDLICRRLSSLNCTKKIVTNATLLTDENLSLIDETFDIVQVSIDGGTKEEYEAIRGNDVFLKLLSGLDKLSRISYKVQVNCVLTPLNHLDIDKLFELSFEYGFKKIRFIYVVDLSRHSVLNCSMITDFLTAIRKAEDKYRDIELSVVFPSKVMHDYCRYLEPNNISNYIGICYAGTVYTVIDSDGTVYPCNFLVGQTPLFPFVSDSFHQDWKNNEFLHSLRNDIGNHICLNCPANPEYSIRRNEDGS